VAGCGGYAFDCTGDGVDGQLKFDLAFDASHLCERRIERWGKVRESIGCRIYQSGMNDVALRYRDRAAVVRKQGSKGETPTRCQGESTVVLTGGHFGK
jgi:hypothetical protein